MVNETAERKIGVTSFVLHVVAMTLMLSDHLWGSFLANYPIFGYIGRITFPIFAFMIVEGFTHTSNRKKYLFRMLDFALVSEIPFNLMTEHRFFNPLHQNVLFSFSLGILMLFLFEKIAEKKRAVVRVVLYALVTVAAYLLGYITFVDYYGYGILMIALFYFTRRRPCMKTYQKVVIAIVQLAAMYWINCEMMMGMMIPINLFGFVIEVYKQGFAILALPLIWLYNGKQGYYNKVVKNVYYWFYPVHMLIIGLLMKYL